MWLRVHIPKTTTSLSGPPHVRLSYLGESIVISSTLTLAQPTCKSIIHKTGHGVLVRIIARHASSFAED